MPFSNTLKRRSKILEILNTEGVLSVVKLSEMFKISQVSIRNDLSHLEKKDLLIKTRGGAIKLQTINVDSNLSQRLNFHLTEKQKIGKKAAEFVKDGDFIVLDSGSTTIEVAKHLLKYKNIKVLTNSLPIAEILSDREQIEVIILGGILRNEMRSMTGNLTVKNIQNFNCNVAFIGADSIDPRKGIFTPSISEASLSQMMMEISKRTVVVLDSSKFTRNSFVRISDFKSIHVLITDKGIAPTHLKCLQDTDMQIVLV